MYEWHSLDHVPLTNSYASAAPASKSEPFDYFHINSIDTEQDGDLLVDSRNTWAAYDVDPKTGQVRWELGGKHSSFKLGPGAATAWQHDARQQPDGAITFFDNGAFPAVHPQSRAIELALDSASMTATLVRSYEHQNPLVAGSQGNVQALPDGDWMVGWGQAGYLSEVTPAGQVLFNAHLPPDWESYRTFALPWAGQPAEPPALAVGDAAAGRGHPGGDCLRELERRDGSRLLAGARGIFAQRPGAGGGRAEERLRDGDCDSRVGERALRGGAGAQQRWRGDRRFSDGERVARPVRPPRLPDPTVRPPGSTVPAPGSTVPPPAPIRPPVQLLFERPDFAFGAEFAPRGGRRGGVPRGREVVGEAARVRCGQARRQRAPQLLPEGTLQFGAQRLLQRAL